MVTRKSIPENTSVDPVAASQFRVQDARRELWSATESESSGDMVWGADQSSAAQNHSPLVQPATQQGTEAISRSLNPLDDAPDALRPGGTSAWSLSPSPSPVPDPVPVAPVPATQYTNNPFDGSDENVWRDEPENKVLLPLSTTGTGSGITGVYQTAFQHEVPDALRPGAGAVKPETNPFKRKPTPGSSQDAVNTIPPMPLGNSPAAAADAFSQLGITTEPSNNPWQPALDEQKLAATSTGGSFVPIVDEQDTLKDAWASKEPSRKPSPSNNMGHSPSLMSFPSEEEGEGSSSAWDELASPKNASPPKPPAPVGATDTSVFEDQHAWDDVGKLEKGKNPERQPALIPDLDFGNNGNGQWNLMDEGPRPGELSRRSTWEDFEDAADEPSSSAAKEPLVPITTTGASIDAVFQPSKNGKEPADPTDIAPKLPPRTSTDAPQPPPRASTTSKTETYQIKNINWHDVNASKNPRTSPILVQNANGPCPLVALVNALTLTTPADIKTALVDTLRSREQISLSFLLDAVFDELMSSRRVGEDAALPDVSDLYDFLKGLHTGMNVNPRFVPTPAVVKAFQRTSLTHIHPAQRSGSMIPGTFEDTREMRLYATFAIPLIHGWIPAPDDSASEAFRRQAESYEDAQNLLFREEELEEKLLSSPGAGLSEEEQRVYQDILTIKSFLSISATQLTAYGLEVITEAMKPGSIAILFRNDHFSTLYRHPQTLELLTLVTDAGYAGHAEIVWESLVDVNGERAEFFSGDFRLVGGASHGGNNLHQRSASMPGAFPGGESSSSGVDDDGSGGWTTVTNRKHHNHHGSGGSTSAAAAAASSSSATAAAAASPMSPSSELEDRDLALAMQLQEEEDQRHREEQARRHRESQLSEQFIEQQARRVSGTSSSVPVTTSGGRGGRRSSATGGGSSGMGRGSPASSSSGLSTGLRAGRGGLGGRTQVVRPLVPPAASNPAPAVRRHADDGAEDAPPSYEQASKQTAYVPPEGHPSHPASSPRVPGVGGENLGGGGGAGAPGTSAPATGGSMRGGRRVSNFTDPSNGGGASSPRGPGRGYRQGVPPVSGGVGGRERDCIVM